MTKIDIVKLDHEGNEVFRYPGSVLERTDSLIIVEAFFTWAHVPVGPIAFKKGDRFVETYYFDRWYNVFEVHQGDSQVVKGYYCNFGTPAEVSNGEVSYRDLALDLLVLPDGRQIVLDEDEFEALNLDKTTSQKVRQTMDYVQAMFAEKLSPKR